MGVRISWNSVLAIVAGLVWLISGAGTGVAGFVLGALPGSLLLAGGVSQLWLPRDVRTLQMSALGGALGAVLALPMLFVVGFLATLWLLVLAAGSFMAAGWASQRRQVLVPGVPEPTLEFLLAAKIGLDEAILATVLLARRGFVSLDTDRVVAEIRGAHELFTEQGWIEKPASFYAEPPALESAPPVRGSSRRSGS